MVFPIEHVVTQLRNKIGSSHIVQLRAILSFMRYAAKLQNDIILCQDARKPHNIVPPFLPMTIQDFLADACKLSIDVIPAYWTVLGPYIWDDNFISLLCPGVEEAFKQYGHARGLGAYTVDRIRVLLILPYLAADSFYPPNLYCTTPGCTNTAPLKKAHQRSAAFFTLRRGALKAFSTSLYCTGCNTDYHHNYAVRSERRTYYSKRPIALQVSEHHFVEWDLVYLWTSMMGTSWYVIVPTTTQRPTYAYQGPLQRTVPSYIILQWHHLAAMINLM